MGHVFPTIFLASSPSIHSTGPCSPTLITVGVGGGSPTLLTLLCAITVRGLDVGARPTLFGSDGGDQVGEGMGGVTGRMKKKPVELAFRSKPSTWIPAGDILLLDLYYDPWLYLRIPGFGRCLAVDGNLYWKEDGMDVDVDVGMGSKTVGMDEEEDPLTSSSRHEQHMLPGCSRIWATAVSLYSAHDEVVLAHPLGFGLSADDRISLEVNVVDVYATWVPRNHRR
ncbi:hypothetical protein ONZ45_g11143 [Pleurotus djamor]|nr:hypothetical protein ONZ45_g11143 [Pleurotus djamor]